jgi:hypothetical protein
MYANPSRQQGSHLPGYAVRRKMGSKHRLPLNDKYVFTLHTRPTPIQQRAFELLALNPDRTQ